MKTFKNIIYFIIPAVLSYVIVMFILVFILKLLSINIYEFDIFTLIMLTVGSVVTFFPLVVMKTIYQIIRAAIDKDYLKRISNMESISIGEAFEKHVQNLEVYRKNASGDYEGARRLREHFDEMDTLKKIEKNTRK